MTKEEFKKLWEADDNGSCITFDDIAYCAKEWGLYSMPKCANIQDVLYAVLKAAGCTDAEDYNPEWPDTDEGSLSDDLKELEDLVEKFYNNISATIERLKGGEA